MNVTLNEREPAVTILFKKISFSDTLLSDRLPLCLVSLIIQQTYADEASLFVQQDSLAYQLIASITQEVYFALLLYPSV